VNVLLEKIKIKQLETFPKLIHGISPRCFKNHKDEIVEFNFLKGDENKKTKDHLKIFLESIGVKNCNIYIVNQTHSDKILLLDDSFSSPQESRKIEADALLTNIPGRPIGIFTADCLPVLVYDPEHDVIGAIHAGRKGSEQNIVFKVVEEMGRVYGSRPEELIAGFGPAIGVCCYEVEEDCMLPFKNLSFDKESWFRPGLPGKYFIDLIEVNKMQCEGAGLLKENIFPMNHCTCCSVANMYSYRREGKTGRILTAIMLRSG
jgi:polyphenol oxidase